VRRGRRATAPAPVVRRAELELSIFVRAGDRYGDRPLYHELVDLARCAGLRGATVVRGLQGFGGTATLRSAGLSGHGGYEPVLIQITDDAARVRAFLPVARQLVGSGLIVTKAVTSVRSTAGAPGMAIGGRVG
jgi:PII-like signaling protein